MKSRGTWRTPGQGELGVLREAAQCSRAGIAQVDFPHQRTILGSQGAALISKFIGICPRSPAAPSQAAALHPCLLFQGEGNCFGAGFLFRCSFRSRNCTHRGDINIYTHISLYMNGFLVCTHVGVFMAHFPAQRGNPKPSKYFWGLTHPSPSFESSTAFPTRPWSSWSFAQTEGVTTSPGKVKLLKDQLLIPKPFPHIPPQALRDPKV